MAQTLSDALHARLDEMAGERTPDPVEAEEPEAEVEDETLETEEQLDADAEGQEAEAGDASAEEGEDEGDVAEETRDKWILKDFAEATGLTVQDLYDDLLIPLGVKDADGNAKTISLGQLKDSVDQVEIAKAEVNQAREAIRQEYMQLQQQQQRFLQGSQAVSQEVQEAAGEVAAIEAQYAQVDWDKLEEADPGRAANYRQKFATAYAAAQNKVKQAEQRAEQERNAAMQQYIQQHNQVFLERMPHWRNREIAEREGREITDVLVQRLGWTPQELSQIYDARARETAYWAWKGLMAEQNQQQAVAKLKKAPKKVIRSARPSTNRAKQEKTLAALEKRALETGRSSDKLAAARAIMQASMKR